MPIDEHARQPTAPERLWLAFEARDWEGAAALLYPDLIAEWPLTRERFRGRDAFIKVNRDYPEGWHITTQQVVNGGDRVATQARVVMGDAVDYALSFFEVRDGLITRITDWWPGGDYDPPA